MKVVYISRVSTYDQIKSFEGDWFKDEWLTQSPFTESVMIKDKDSGKMIAVFKKNAISNINLVANIEKAAAPKLYRGTAAGPVDMKFMPRYVAKLRPKTASDTGINNSKNWTYYYKHDGTTNKYQISNQHLSGVVGYMEKRGRFKCRLTAYSSKHLKQHQMLQPFVEEVDQLYRHHCPNYHKDQKERANMAPKFRLWGSAFSTITVNKNFNTALHMDSGDYHKGLACMAVYSRGAYNGFETCLPEYGIGFDVRPRGLFNFLFT